MKSFFLVCLLVILAGCSPQKRLARLLEKHPLPVDTIVVDSTVYHDSIVYINIPGEIDSVMVYIPELVEVPDTSLKTTTAFAEATAGITSGDLWLKLVQTDTLIVYELDSVIVEKEVIKTITTTVPEYIKPNPFWKHGFLVLVGLFLIVVCLFFVFRK